MEIRLTKQIEAPPERVFAVATDFAHAPEIIDKIQRVEMLTEGPVGVGTRFKETRTVFGREATEEMDVVAFDAPRSYVLGCESHGCRYRTEFHFTPLAGGTEVVMTFRAQALTFFARVMGFLMKPMLKKLVGECAKDLDDLARAVEAKSRPGNSLPAERGQTG